ncbi:MAG TPA: hypothetical protein PLV83_05300 [Bacilli bacterium]|nr:hypothetical protein [Bacilli bacterium]
MNVFICDIIGTYLENYDTKNSKEDLIEFVNHLQRLIEIEEMNELIFSFESSNALNEVKSCMIELSKYIEGTNIKMGMQFGSDKYLDIDGKEHLVPSIGKITQTTLLLSNKKVNKIYFADDNLLNQKMTENFLSGVNNINDNKSNYSISYNELVQFVPGLQNDDKKTKGLKTLNEILDNYINKLEKTNKMIK